MFTILLCNSRQVSSGQTVIGSALSIATVVTVTEFSATASVCRVYSAQLATSLVRPELGVQTASSCVTARHFNTLPAAIQRSEHVEMLCLVTAFVSST